MIDKELIDAYANAKYIADINGKEISIKVGHMCDELYECLKVNNKNSAFFITPENPFSEQLSKDENELRHQEFLLKLNSIDAKYFLGYGTDKKGQWPRENSYLILIDEEEKMVSLAKLFDQNAMLKINMGSPVELIPLFN